MPLYQPVYSTTARQVAARAGQDRVPKSSPSSEGEETLCHGVAPALTLAADQQSDLAVFRESSVGGGGALAAAAGVEDHPGCGVAGGDRAGQGIGGELGAWVVWRQS